jgi:hypothetical protein
MASGWVYDYETLANCFVAVFVNYKSEETKVFVVHELRNDFPEFMDFLENCADSGDRFIGFNVLGFDAQITQALLQKREALESLAPGVIAQKIYKKAQDIIATQEFGDKFAGIPDWKLSIPHIDLFKVNHWDNPGKKASLKWLEYTTDWHNVMEMPIHHSTRIETMEQIDQIIEYCTNDVLFTKHVIYEKSKPLLKIRQDLQKKYSLKCINYSNTKLGSELLLKMYCKKTGKKKFDVKDSRTKRASIIVRDIIFPYITFDSPEFKGVLNKYNETIISNTRGDVKFTQNFMGYTFHYGAGGIHQCIKKGIYKADDEYIIEDADVGSLYPNIGVQNGLYPAHLGEEFYQVYKNEIVDVRMAEKAKGKDGNKAIVDGFKEAANASYGNSNQEHSWLLDPQYTMTITINGQLMLSMLVERLMSSLTGAQLLQTNTDGLTIRYKRSEQPLYKQICKQWEAETKLQLEFVEMSAMYIWDVNNYIVTYKDATKPPKCKGRFQFLDLEMHKNKSFLIIPKAIYAFFAEGIFPEEYLRTNRNIFDYCAGNRVNGEWHFLSTCMVDGKVVEEPLQKVIRYYISNTGCKIIKHNESDGRKISTVAGQWLQTVYNVHHDSPWESYDVNTEFYLTLIREEIDKLITKVPQQMVLF